MLETTEKKVDILVDKASLSLIGEPKRDTQCDLVDKLKKIEAASQEDTTEQVLKRKKRYCPFEFWMKGHKEQYL